MSDRAAPSGAQTGVGFYGWWAVVPAGFIILLVTNALTVGGIAAFDPSLIERLGVARADIKLGDAIQLGITAFATLVTGWCADRFGVRIVLAAGVAVLAAAFFYLPQVETIEQYYLSRLLMGIGLSGAGLAIVVTFVSRWFVLKRGLALGIVLAGTSLGNAIFPLIFTALIRDYDWQHAARVGGWMVIALFAVIALFVKEWPKDRGIQPFGADRLAAAQGERRDPTGPELGFGEILARKEFWLMGIAAFCTFYTILGVNNNMILHMQNVGVGVEIGAAMAFPLFMAGLVGKLASGWLTDVFGRKPVWLASLGMMFSGCAMLALMQPGLVPVAAIALGLGWGSNYTLLQAVAGDLFGARSLGRVMGAVTVLDAGGGALGPYVTARFADAYGNYQMGFAVTAVLVGIAMVCATLLKVATPDLEARSLAPQKG